MIKHTRITTMAAALFLSGALAATATAGQPRYDLTGTWTGSIKCKSFSAGVKDKFTLTPTMKISQSGLEIGLVLDYGGGDTEVYAGLANPDAKKPDQKGQLAVVFCGTDDQIGNDPVSSTPTFDELGTMAVSTKPPTVKASFKGTSIFSDPGILQAEAGTCKWKWTRTSLDDPGVLTSCAQPILRLPPSAP